ncbi:uncharacterized protein [Ptychodera flava]|uniref:uncharacterized protein n=1 Tax=Ptychodera flava TaxID=63121 RepID=UPI00396A8B91
MQGLFSEILLILISVTTVTVLVVGNDGHWITSPQNRTVLVGGSVTIGCQIENRTSDGLKPRWYMYRNGLKTKLSDSGGIVDQFKHSYDITGEDVGQYNLRIKKVSRTDNTTFICSHINADPQHQKTHVNVISRFVSVAMIPHGGGIFSCNGTHGYPQAIRMLWRINGVEVLSTEPWSIETTDGYFSSSSVYEIDNKVYSGDITLSCDVIQSDLIKSMAASITLKTSNGGANTADATTILMAALTVMTVLL